MAEFIELEAVTSKVYKLRMDAFRRNDRKECFCYNKVYSLLVNAPAVDVAPVVHSKWKYYHKQGKAVCMNCSFERGVDDNFGGAVACPNCGARMDGE